MSVDAVPSSASAPATIPLPLASPPSASPPRSEPAAIAPGTPPSISLSPIYAASAAVAAAPRHIRLTSHSGGFGALPIHWGAASAAERGPIVGTTTSRAHRNVIGTHSGSYSVYRALAVAAGALKREHKADLTNT